MSVCPDQSKRVIARLTVDRRRAHHILVPFDETTVPSAQCHQNSVTGSRLRFKCHNGRHLLLERTEDSDWSHCVLLCNYNTPPCCADVHFRLQYTQTCHL